ncbi:MAG: ribonuclease P protein component [Chloroflexota bacterium]
MQRQFRLRHSADFDRLRVEGRTWRHSLLNVAVAPNGLDHNRYGFITSRRLGGAVVRNRVRRLLREVARLATPHLKTGFDVVFIARNEIAGQPYNKVKDALETLLKRARMWQEDVQP